MKTLRICLIILCATVPALAGDNEFRGVVRSIESNYGVHHLRIPLLGCVLFFVRPEGLSGLKVAIFENFPGVDARQQITGVVENSLGPGWFPFVRVRSSEDRETTLVYANPNGGKMRMLVVDIEPSEATVVELNLNDRAVKKWLKEPHTPRDEHVGNGYKNRPDSGNKDKEKYEARTEKDSDPI
jgi:hypothetical protein